MLVRDLIRFVRSAFLFDSATMTVGHAIRDEAPATSRLSGPYDGPMRRSGVRMLHVIIM